MAVLEGKTAVVTGGSRGIGRAIVERLSRDGARVIFGYLSREDDARAVAGATGAIAVRADLATPEGVSLLFDQAAELDILVNNAAAQFALAAIADVTEEDYDLVMTVNAKSVFRAIQHAARHMRDNGRIITISTLNTVSPAIGGSLYCGSKGAVEQFSAVAAAELGPRGITVNTVRPGATDTELLRSVNSEEGLQMAARETPLGRLGEPADIADVVAFLAGPDARWITGQNLMATGGLLV
jgi:3-oxoacyl-[acyl-carrier protein] reductase